MLSRQWVITSEGRTCRMTSATYRRASSLLGTSPSRNGPKRTSAPRTRAAASASLRFWVLYALGASFGFPRSPRLRCSTTIRSPSWRCSRRTAPAVSSMSPACAPMARMARGDAGVEGCCDESGVAGSRAATTTSTTLKERRLTAARLRAHPDRLDTAVVVLQDLDEGRLLLGHAHGPGLRHADAMSEPAAPGDESGELLRVR